ncbi:peptidase M16, partial [Xylella fastidiosa]
MLRPLPLLIIGILGLGTATFTPQVNATSGTLTISSKAIPKQDIPEIAYERFTLPNGLTVIVHEDHKAPVIAVNVWYHIGSADEPARKTGFAHLFEHLMFSGSENHKASYFQPFEKIGATGMNGTTWFDRTNYFQTVPTTALDMALWMESDRMGHLLGAIGQKELDTQRGVVKNEKRQRENVPYGRVTQNILSNLFPANHPYQHSTIGSMEDLEAASLADVKSWFQAH